MIASEITAPSLVIRWPSHAGTRPLCRGRSALPARRAIRSNRHSSNDSLDRRIYHLIGTDGTADTHSPEAQDTAVLQENRGGKRPAFGRSSYDQQKRLGTLVRGVSGDAAHRGLVLRARVRQCSRVRMPLTDVMLTLLPTRPQQRLQAKAASAERKEARAGAERFRGRLEDPSDAPAFLIPSYQDPARLSPASGSGRRPHACDRGLFDDDLEFVAEDQTGEPEWVSAHRVARSGHDHHV